MKLLSFLTTPVLGLSAALISLVSAPVNAAVVTGAILNLVDSNVFLLF